MRTARIGALSLGLALSSGCVGLLPSARLEVTADAETSAPSVVFDFARAETRAGTVFGHRVQFVLSDGVSEARFHQKRTDPEVWRLGWTNASDGAEHEILVVVEAKRDQSRVELLRPRRGLPSRHLHPETHHPELGDRIGLYEGREVRLFLLEDGSVQLEDDPD
jgi:hypothetical protein